MKRQISLTSSETLALETIREILGERPVLAERLLSELSMVPATEQDDPARRRILTVVSERLDDEQFSAEELARAIGLSRSSLERVCREGFGLAPGSLIRLVRLEVAAELLATSDLDIGEVAFAVGYSGIPQFTRAFKQCYGASPTQWRKRERLFRAR